MNKNFEKIFDNFVLGDKISVKDLSFKVIKNAEVAGADFKNEIVFIKMGKKSLGLNQDQPVVIKDNVFLAKSTDPKYKVVKFQYLCLYKDLDKYAKNAGK